MRGREAERGRLEALNEADGPLFKIRNDPRTTRVGQVIRKPSLDELPQFINVLRGEMSLSAPAAGRGGRALSPGRSSASKCPGRDRLAQVGGGD
jgi:hypothetical protein